jgi:hypothetical protein
MNIVQKSKFNLGEIIMRHAYFDKRFNRTRNIVVVFIGFIWIMTITVLFGCGYVVYKVSEEVGDKGLKSVVEQLWYGKKGELT